MLIEHGFFPVQVGNAKESNPAYFKVVANGLWTRPHQMDGS